MSNTNFGDVRMPILDLQSLHRSYRKAYSGKINCSIFFTPTNAVTSTILRHPKISIVSYIALFPLTAESSALAEKFYEDRTIRTQGSATILHPILTTGTDFPFMAIVIG